MSSAFCFNLDQSKLMSSGNGLKHKSKREQGTVKRKIDDKQQLLAPLAKDRRKHLVTNPRVCLNPLPDIKF